MSINYRKLHQLRKLLSRINGRHKTHVIKYRFKKAQAAQKYIVSNSVMA